MSQNHGKYVLETLLFFDGAKIIITQNQFSIFNFKLKSAAYSGILS